MVYRTDEPLFTAVYDPAAQFVPRPDGLCVFGESPEDRSKHLEEWTATALGLRRARLISDTAASARFLLDGEKELEVHLRDQQSVNGLFESVAHAATYLDITGLPHRVWAPLLRAMRSRATPSFGMYVEPVEYQRSKSPTEVTQFDLSERIGGVEPLPGFVSLVSDETDSRVVVLLGFEGARLKFMLENVGAEYSSVFPVVGVPGFRHDYPFSTYLGNSSQLIETKAWRNVTYAAANCPFAVYHLLKDLAAGSASQSLRVAMIGTKPHAFGAILYGLDHPLQTELLYDHPVRSPKRTQGVGRLCVYDLSLLPLVRPDRAASVS